MTDDRGMYTILDLAPGRYVVSLLAVQSTVLMTIEEAAPIRAIGALQGGAVSAGRDAAVQQ